MKKNNNYYGLRKPDSNWNKFILTMKISAILLFCSLVSAIASPTYSQSTRISLNLKDVTIDEVLSKIENESEFYFLFNQKLIDVTKKVSIEADKEPIGNILADLFHSDVKAVVYDRQIVLTPNDLSVPFESPQQVTVKGTIKDANTNEVLGGVTVVVQGTTQGTFTDTNGSYLISVPKSGAVLVFSSVGYTTQKIEVGTQSVIDIAMIADIISMEEVVVIGYGTAKRKDVIGSVATVHSAEIVNPVIPDFNAMLQGKASGVYVSQGDIRIRGMNSISSSTEPLYVIDGVVMANAGNLINPNDIESIDIQKDAAATAIYGSRASNGVIMITTKSGKAGSNSFTFDYSTGISSYINDGFKRADANTQLAAMDLSIQNSRVYDPTILDRPYDPKEAFTYDVKFLTDENGNTRNFDYFTRDYVKPFNTDLPKEVRRNATFNEFNVATNKSFEKGGLFFSMKYRDENGNMKGDYGNKITARLGTNFSPLKNFKIGFISTIAYTKHTNGITSVSDRWLPFMPLYDETSPTGLWVTAANPLSRANHNYSDDNQTNLRSISNLTAEYTVPFVQGLSVKLVAGYDYITGKAVNWSSSLMNDATNTQPLSRANETQSNSAIAMANIGLNYDRTFGDHNVTAVLYQEGQKSKSNYSYLDAENLSTKFHEIGTSPGTLLSMNSGLNGDFRLLSTLGRVGYKFQSRYLLEASLRLDATSKFSPEKQNATFGSVGAGWIISEESFFMNSISWINLLKIRGSIGQTGNGDMPDFKYLNAYTIGKWFMNQQYSYIQNIGNPEITWETSNNTDIGVDFGLFKSKVNGSIAYYKKNVNGLLLEVPLPMSAGIPGGNTVWQNVGDMSNTGVEISVNYSPVKSSDFSWDMSFNFSTNKNKIIALHPAVDAKGWGIEGNYTPTITRTGGKLATFYLPEYAGIDPGKGIPMIYERDADIYASTGETVKTGKLIPFNSVTGAANRFIQDGKSSMPDWYGGFNNNFRYKSFDLNLMFSYAGNSYFINEAARSSRNVSFGWQRLADDILEDSWKKPGDNAKYQELIYGGGYYYDSEGNKIDKPVEEYGGPSTRELTRNDYIRLRFITLGYNLPISVVSKIKLSGIRVYASVNNAFTISKAPAEIDPELGIPGNLDGNMVYYGLPPTRTYSFGVSIKF